MITANRRIPSWPLRIDPIARGSVDVWCVSVQSLERRLEALSALLTRRSYASVVEEVALAAVSLAGKRLGALIVFERELGLRAFSETGITLDADVSYDLLVSVGYLQTSTRDDSRGKASSSVECGVGGLPSATVAGNGVFCCTAATTSRMRLVN